MTVQYPVTLAPGTQTVIQYPGAAWIGLLMSNKPLTFAFDQGSLLTLFRGDLYEIEFGSVIISNGGTVTVTATVVIGDADSGADLLGTRLPSTFAHKNDAACGTGAVTQIITGSPGSRFVYLSIDNTQLHPAQVRVGGANVNANAGMLLLPGLNPFVVETSSDLYVYNNSGNTVIVSASVGNN